jgi:transcriptional regulator with XRE-family HTH domain
MVSSETTRRISKAGQVLKAYRKSHSITQTQLAHELGVEPRTLRMYENGERMLDNILELRRISDLLSIDPEDFGLSARRSSPIEAQQVRSVIEHVWLLMPQARFLEAQLVITKLLDNLKEQPVTGDVSMLSSLAHAHYTAGHIESIINRTYTVDPSIAHFREMERIARHLNDTTLLAFALTYQGDQLRRRGDITHSLVCLKEARVLLSEQERKNAALVDPQANGNTAQLLARVCLREGDWQCFEREMATAEEMASRIASSPTSHSSISSSQSVHPANPFDLMSVYEEYARAYARRGEQSKSIEYIERAEQLADGNIRWGMVLKATRAEAFIYSGDLATGLPLALETTHLALIYNHSRLLERLFRIQQYLDKQVDKMRQAQSSLNEALHGVLEV